MMQSYLETEGPRHDETVVAKLPGGWEFRVQRDQDGTAQLIGMPIATGDSVPRLAEVRRQLTKGLTR